ncbi:hypothetical protein H920_05286 [Fukomys damarensis]|uniref:Uncharacterized protein n=1 Tax=Fukomys damarensis TaxID=885580 RepID=A0A091DRJ3_FUKDA|nr:hypothetical protein H920_05286 [Fukomys damarensis]
MGAGPLAAAALALVLANTDMFLSRCQEATREYLEDRDLKTLEKDSRTFKAKEMGKERSCDYGCAEARLFPPSRGGYRPVLPETHAG